MRFLLHLEDYRKTGHHGVEHGLQAIKTISSRIQEYQLPSSEVKDKLERIITDLDYLDSKLSALGVTIREDKDMLRQHFQLTQDQTLFRLTILAAIFLPLSFATSFFGMNIDGLPDDVETFFNRKPEDPLPEDKDKPEFLRALDRITDVDTHSATAALAAILGSNDATWTTFAITAICLLCTLPAALMAGAIIRGIIVAVAKYVVYWRGLAILGIALVFLLTTYSEYVPWLRDYQYTKWAFSGLFLLFELWQTYRSWKKTRQRFFWTFLLALTGACVVKDVYVYTYMFPTMIVPWFFLALWYTIPWLIWRYRQV